MAEEFDVTARLTEGGPAVETVQQYVWACHQIGYQHPDLTLHAAQIRDRYGTEDGMDLTALHSDWLALEDTARAAQDALAVQDRQLSVLSTAWQGSGARASWDFLRRHGEASAAVAAAARTAAEALGALRESLWRSVDAKVDAVVAIDDRAQAHRAEWLAAAATVTTCVGDRAVAAELVDQQVKPFVDSSIRSDWLTAMHTATSSVTGAYERAAAEIAAEHDPVFELPGDLGPTWTSPPPYIHRDTGVDERLPGPGTAGPAITAPAAWSPIPAAAAAPLLPAPPAAPGPVALPPETPAGPAAPSMPPMPSLGGMGSGMPDFGGGLPGLGQQFADMLSGLLGGADSVETEVPDLDVPELDATEEEEDAADDEEAAPDEDAEEDVIEERPAEEVYEGTSELPADPADPAPVPTPAPPPAEPMPPADLPTADQAAAEQTPCAIAAGELPQVGDPPQ